MNESITDTFFQLKNNLELSLEELALIFKLSADDLKSLELGLMPLDYKNFKRRVLHLKELTDFLERSNESTPVAKIFKTPQQALGNKSALDILIYENSEQAFYDVSGFFYRSFK